jgi:peptidoglycan/xylan/chitin deacetylase (PgdA/CDA1 family)
MNPIKYNIGRLITGIYPKTCSPHVLMYHSVTKNNNGDLFSTSIENFKQQMHWIKANGFEIVPWGQWSEGKKQIIVTFDDGYKDNLELVAPFMEKENLSFTVFVVSDFIDKSSEYVTTNQLCELAKVANIGGHGKTHRPLAQLSADEISQELIVSKKKLSDILQKEVCDMSYPHGSVNAIVQEAVRLTGFKTAGVSQWGSVYPLRNPFWIRRIPILKIDSLFDFKQKVLGKWNWMGKLGGNEYL